MWNKEFSVGDATIDEQHKKLLEQLEGLVLALEKPDHEKTTRESVDFLEKYINEHLAYEEKYMKEHGYPDIEAHIKLHLGFRKKFESFRKRIDAGESHNGLGKDVREFMEEWWVLHILHDDKLYGIHIDKHPDCHPKNEDPNFHQALQT